MTKKRGVRSFAPSVPTVDDVLAIHEKEVQRSGDTEGILNRGSLEAALERARHGPFEGPGSVLERAALLLRGICQDHPFADGNKRTALASVETFLERNGFFLDSSPENLRDFMLAVARIELDLDGILTWFARHIETVKPEAIQ